MKTYFDTDEAYDDAMKEVRALFPDLSEADKRKMELFIRRLVDDVAEEAYEWGTKDGYDEAHNY